MLAGPELAGSLCVPTCPILRPSTCASVCSCPHLCVRPCVRPSVRSSIHLCICASVAALSNPLCRSRTNLTLCIECHDNWRKTMTRWRSESPSSSCSSVSSLHPALPDLVYHAHAVKNGKVNLLPASMYMSQSYDRCANDPDVDVRPSIRPSIHPSIDPAFHPAIHPSVSPPIRPSLYPAIRPSGHPRIRLSIHPAIHPLLRLQETKIVELHEAHVPKDALPGVSDVEIGGENGRDRRLQQQTKKERSGAGIARGAKKQKLLPSKPSGSLSVVGFSTVEAYFKKFSEGEINGKQFLATVPRSVPPTVRPSVRPSIHPAGRPCAVRPPIPLSLAAVAAEKELLQRPRRIPLWPRPSLGFNACRGPFRAAKSEASKGISMYPSIRPFTCPRSHSCRVRPSTCSDFFSDS